MDANIIKFDDTEIRKCKLHQHKSPISRSNININKILVSNKIPFNKQDFKYFIGWKDAKKNQTFINIPHKNGCIQKNFLIKLNLCT